MIGAHGIKISRERVASAAIVLALHAGVVAWLLEITLVTPAPLQERETVVMLEQLPKAAPGSGHGHRVAGPGAIIVVPLVPPVFPPLNAPALGEILFGCRPENLDRLPEEVRARCRLALGGPSGGRWTAYKKPPEESQYAELWRQGIKARETPVQVPCVGASGGGRSSAQMPGGESQNGPPAKVKPGFSVDYVCIALRLWQELNR